MFWFWGPLLLAWPFWLLGQFVWIALLALLLWALVRLFRSGRAAPVLNPARQPVQPTAMEILRQRYARGEIDAVTYEQMRERLEPASGPRQQ
jgi:uncharacterized membrane protein